MTRTVGAYGTQMSGLDDADSGYCVGVAGGQIQASTEIVNIPTQYELTSGGDWYPIGNVTQTASEDAEGDLTKRLAVYSTTVSSPGT